jgi:hypothetical protein
MVLLYTNSKAGADEINMVKITNTKEGKEIRN